MQYLLGDFECQEWQWFPGRALPTVYEAAGSICSPSERTGTDKRGRGDWYKKLEPKKL